MPCAGLRVNVLLCLIVFFGLVSGGTYYDDSLVVREILDVNGLDTVTVESVTSVIGGRVYGLYLHGMQLHTLPESLGDLDSLGNLQIQENQIPAIPRSIGSCKFLQYLSAYNNLIHELPEEITECKNLVLLYLFGNRFAKWPEILSELPKLESINLADNHLIEVPAAIADYQSLTDLSLYNNYLSALPEQFIDMVLKSVSISGNVLCSLTPEMELWLDTYDWNKEDGRWRTYQACDSYGPDSAVVWQLLVRNGWDAVTVEAVTESSEYGIVKIDVSHENLMQSQPLPKKQQIDNGQMELPGDINSLKSLRSLDISGHGFSSLPDELSGLCHITSLDLSNNNLTKPPGFLAMFSNIESLDVSGNALSEMTPEVEAWVTEHDPDWKETQQVVERQSHDKESPVGQPTLHSARYSTRTIVLDFRIPENSEAELALYTSTGRMAGKADRRYYDAGMHTVCINAGYVSPGYYIAVLKRQGSTITLPVVFH